ncbi:hypothetical protein [Streptomyces sp. NPDC002845]
MKLAPLPDHRLTQDKWWQSLYGRYGHVVTPLRAKGWVTDVETVGNNYTIRADLADGTELVISTADTLPADPSHVTGWLIVRTPVGDATHQTVLYNSTPGGAHDHHGKASVPMFRRLASLFPSHRDDCFHMLTVKFAPSGYVQKTAGPHEDAGTAVARYIEHANKLAVEGWRMTWRAQSDRPFACTWERDSHLTVLQLADDAI